MSEYYPNFEQNSFEPLYYVEFNRGDKPNEFTLFKRNWFYTSSGLDELEANNVYSHKEQAISWLRISNECHPYNLFTASFGPDGCSPDKKWVKFMVDALNEKAKNENQSPKTP